MSETFFDYIQAIKPSLGDEDRATVGLLLIHFITLARVSDGRVRLENILTASGRSFVRKVLRHMSLVRGLGFALKVDMSCIFDDSPVPEGLKRLCEKYYIDVDACMRRNKKLESARGEMWDLVIFVRVAQAVMAALHEETLCSLDKSYRGHRPAGYKPKPKWFGFGTNDPTPPVLARDLPRAKAPRAVGLKTAGVSTSPSGPVSMTRKTSDISSASGSSGSTSNTHKRSAVPRPPATVSPSARPCHFVPPPAPMATPSPAAYYAQCAAMAAYYQAMQQGMANRRMH